MHIAYGHKHDLKIDETSSIAHESILSRTTIATETSLTTNTVTTTTVHTSIPEEEEEETTPLISRPQQAVDSGKILQKKNFFFSFLF